MAFFIVPDDLQGSCYRELACADCLTRGLTHVTFCLDCLLHRLIGSGILCMAFVYMRILQEMGLPGRTEKVLGVPDQLRLIHAI